MFIYSTPSVGTAPLGGGRVRNPLVNPLRRAPTPNYPSVDPFASVGFGFAPSQKLPPMNRSNTSVWDVSQKPVERTIPDCGSYTTNPYGFAPRKSYPGKASHAKLRANPDKRTTSGSAYAVPYRTMPRTPNTSGMQPAQRPLGPQFRSNNTRLPGISTLQYSIYR